MSQFEINGYEIVENAISKETAKLLATEFNMLRDCVYHNTNSDPADLYKFNDVQVHNSFVWAGMYGFESLLLMVQPIVERITGKTLYPTYSYARIYYNGATMALHKDRPSCQYSATMTIDVEDDALPWEIWMDNLSGVAKPLVLPVGTMAVYCGDKLNHWRKEFKGNKQIQVFLHYVDANGEYAHLKYDRRAMLGLPQ